MTSGPHPAYKLLSRRNHAIIDGSLRENFSLQSGASENSSEQGEGTGRADRDGRIMLNRAVRAFISQLGSYETAEDVPTSFGKARLINRGLTIKT